MTRRIWVPNPSHPTINCWIADRQPVGDRWLVRMYTKGGDPNGQPSRLEIAELEQMVKDSLATELDPVPESGTPSYFDPAYRPPGQTGES